VENLESPMVMLQRAMDTISLAEKFAKMQSGTENEAIAVWAGKVASSYAESVARSAPSSVPSYSSVVSKSVSQRSGTGATSVSTGSIGGAKKPVRSGAVRSSVASVNLSAASLPHSFSELEQSRLVDRLRVRSRAGDEWRFDA